MINKCKVNNPMEKQDDFLDLSDLLTDIPDNNDNTIKTMDFVDAYKKFAERTLYLAKKARNEGLLSLEDDIDEANIKKGDIFDYGLRFSIDGTNDEIVERILSNLINQEKDNTLKRMKAIQKEAVFAIYSGLSSKLTISLLHSLSGLSFEEDEIYQEIYKDE